MSFLLLWFNFWRHLLCSYTFGYVFVAPKFRLVGVFSAIISHRSPTKCKWSRLCQTLSQSNHDFHDFLYALFHLCLLSKQPSTQHNSVRVRETARCTRFTTESVVYKRSAFLFIYTACIFCTHCFLCGHYNSPVQWVCLCNFHSLSSILVQYQLQHTKLIYSPLVNCLLVENSYLVHSSLTRRTEEQQRRKEEHITSDTLIAPSLSSAVFAVDCRLLFLSLVGGSQ